MYCSGKKRIYGFQGGYLRDVEHQQGVPGKVGTQGQNSVGHLPALVVIILLRHIGGGCGRDVQLRENDADGQAEERGG